MREAKHSKLWSKSYLYASSPFPDETDAFTSFDIPSTVFPSDEGCFSRSSLRIRTVSFRLLIALSIWCENEQQGVYYNVHSRGFLQDLALRPSQSSLSIHRRSTGNTSARVRLIWMHPKQADAPWLLVEALWFSWWARFQVDHLTCDFQVEKVFTENATALSGTGSQCEWSFPPAVLVPSSPMFLDQASAKRRYYLRKLWNIGIKWRYEFPHVQSFQIYSV